MHAQYIHSCMRIPGIQPVYLYINADCTAQPGRAIYPNGSQSAPVRIVWRVATVMGTKSRRRIENADRHLNQLQNEADVVVGLRDSQQPYSMGSPSL